MTNVESRAVAYRTNGLMDSAKLQDNVRYDFAHHP